jgi:thioredoxin reductase
VIAIDKGFPVGAAWYRLFDNDRPGYGFVDERTPELAIAVVPNARGKGVGTALLEALLRDARAAGYPTISLSVDRANAGAIELYGRHGFEQVAEDEDSVTMLAQLDTSTSQPTNEGTENRMNVDVAVLGGGPAGYTAAIRATQLGGKVACIEEAPALGGTCLRVGCIPTKAWVQSAHAYHDAQETFAKLGVVTAEPTLEFGTVASWKDAVVDQMTGGIASLFKANGVEWVKGKGTFTGPNAIAVEGAEEVTFKSAIVATGSFPLRPPIPGLDSPRCVDSTGLLGQTQVPARLVVLGGGIIGCEFASIFNRFGTEVTIIEMLPNLIPGEDADASKELEKAFRKRWDRSAPVEAVHAGGRPRGAPHRPLRRGRDRRLRPHARLGRPRGARRGPRARGRGGHLRSDADRHRRPPPHERPAHLRGRRRRGVLAAGPHGLSRGRGRRGERDGPRVQDR